LFTLSITLSNIDSGNDEGDLPVALVSSSDAVGQLPHGARDEDEDVPVPRVRAFERLRARAGRATLEGPGRGRVDVEGHLHECSLVKMRG
jgi:hypothetical protein